MLERKKINSGVQESRNCGVTESRSFSLDIEEHTFLIIVLLYLYVHKHLQL